MDLWFSGELAADQIDGAVGFDMGFGQAEDIDEDGLNRAVVVQVE